MESTWNVKGEEYKAQVAEIEEKLRNAEMAVSKVGVAFVVFCRIIF